MKVLSRRGTEGVYMVLYDTTRGFLEERREGERGGAAYVRGCPWGVKVYEDLEMKECRNVEK